MISRNTEHSSSDGSKTHRPQWWLRAVCFFLAVSACATLGSRWPLRQGRAQRPQPPDPAAWGSDHVGKPWPEFVSGDECLFCHREKVGVSWSKNRHQRTVRPAREEPALKTLAADAARKEIAAQVQWILGAGDHARFLKRTGRYGQLAILSTAWQRTDGDEGRLTKQDIARWDSRTFGQSCAGCHASGVEAATQRFMASSLECFTCHGDVALEHTKEPDVVHLSPRRKDDPRVVASICGQCHIRGGKSRSTERPYPNHFVAGDNLFRDFEVDWSLERIRKLNPADQHVMLNLRDVVVLGKKQTCLACHDVHRSSSEKHLELEDQAICSACHEPGREKTTPRRYVVRSRVCQY